jgi:CRISPR-associated protein Csx3
VYFLRCSLDGEGLWSTEVPAERAAALRRKGPFTDEFAKRIGAALSGVSRRKGLVIADCGGRIDRKQALIWEHCTHGVILSRDPHAVDLWRGALAAYDVEVLATIVTRRRRVGSIDRRNPLTIRLGPFDRRAAGAPSLPVALIDALLEGTGLRTNRVRSRSEHTSNGVESPHASP